MCSSNLFTARQIYYNTILLQIGQRHALRGDWLKTITSYKKSLEGFEAVYGRKDKRVMEVSRLLKVS